MTKKARSLVTYILVIDNCWLLNVLDNNTNLNESWSVLIIVFLNIRPLFLLHKI